MGGEEELKVLWRQLNDFYGYLSEKRELCREKAREKYRQGDRVEWRRLHSVARAHDLSAKGFQASMLILERALKAAEVWDNDLFNEDIPF